MSEQDEFFPATAMPDNAWWSALWPEPGDVVRRLGIEAGMTVLDLCCGNGYFTAPLAELVNGKVYALDIDPEMLEQARSEVARRGASVIEWLCADARDIVRLIPHEIDYALIANTFHGVPDKTLLAESVAQVLTPEGRFAIVNWYPIPRDETVVLGQPRGPKTEMRMSPEQVQGIVEPVGFSLERLVQLPPFHYATVFLCGKERRFPSIQ